MGKSIYTAEHELLCQVLRDQRTRAGLTQQELADRLGKPQSYVSKFETGERRLDLVELRSVARGLGTTLAELVGRFERALS